MAKAASLIYPHQLYADNPVIYKGRLHILIEDILYFGDSRYPIKFHKQKLMLHRATMKRYQDEVLGAGRYQYRYIEYGDIDDRLGYVFEQLANEGYDEIHVVDPTDYMLERRIRRYCNEYNFDLRWYESPNFVTTTEQIEEFYADKDNNDFYQTDFYIWQRKRLNILVTDNNKPIGGKWSYDADNRQKLKKGVTLPDEPTGRDNDYIREARQYIETNFPDNPGQTEPFIYPTNHAEAADWLENFVQVKLDDFGQYQDAITTRGNFLFHSLLSSSLNIGLLDPMQVIETITNYYKNNTVRYASVEGFVRQVIGWREFMRAIYLRAGTQERTDNFWSNQRDLDERWYTGETGIPPIDDAIKKANQYAYNHHIERLMLLGNFMLLCEVHPDNVYRWFMEMFIDSYDWVMVPNVYGMSQYADGGLITTKPYISSSNYVRKMSDYSKGDWATIWDGLYWRFIHKHVDFFKGNPRLAVMTSHLNRMDEEKLQGHLDVANDFLEQMD